LNAVEEARLRVTKSFKALSKRKGDGEGDYVPLKYDPELIRDFYDKQPLK
jgi:hypothetical protein